MAIVFVRIDNRLIHGQVSAAWMAAFDAGIILVADDGVARDNIQRNVLRMAAPAGCRVDVLSTDDAAQKILSGAYDRDKVFLLVKTPASIKAIVDAGVAVPEVNIGNMHFSPGKRQISKSVSVDDRDVEIFRELAGKGVKLEMRWLPSSRAEPLTKLIEGLTPS
jgi:PTS system mannose-specific IIB component